MIHARDCLRWVTSGASCLIVFAEKNWVRIIVRNTCFFLSNVPTVEEVSHLMITYEKCLA